MQRKTEQIEEGLLTQKELSRRLRFTRRTILDRIKDGTIPFVLVGKTKRFIWADVVAKLKSQPASSDEG